MDRNGDEDIRPEVRRKADDLNTIVQIRKNLKKLGECEAEFLYTTDKSLVLKIRQELEEWLTQLENVQIGFRKSLIEDIRKFQSYIDIKCRACDTEAYNFPVCCDVEPSSQYEDQNWDLESSSEDKNENEDENNNENEDEEYQLEGLKNHTQCCFCSKRTHQVLPSDPITSHPTNNLKPTGESVAEDGDLKFMAARELSYGSKASSFPHIGKKQKAVQRLSKILGKLALCVSCPKINCD